MNPTMQKGKSKITVIFILSLLLIVTNAYAELRTDMPADVVIGQSDFTSRGTTVSQSKLYYPRGVFSDGKRLFITDHYNNRVLIWNSIPTTNGAPADVVLGQTDFVNNGSDTTQSTFNRPTTVCSDGKRLYVVDYNNSRVLIWNSIPTTNGVPADVVVGQPDFVTSSRDTTQSKLRWPIGIFSDGKRLFVGDYSNHRILIWNSIPTTNGAPADVVLGQTDFTTWTSGTTRSKFNRPRGVFSDGKRFFVYERNSNRILIWNSIPTTINAPADVVIGQPDFTSGTANQGGGVAGNALDTGQVSANGVFSDGKRLFCLDSNNHRVLVFNSIPTANNTSADIVIGQPNFNSNSINQTGSTTTPGANTLYYPADVFSDGKRLFITDYYNHRVLIYNIGGPSVELGPQFEQGKAVLGKVFNDINENGWQDKGELGIEGVKIASDTGIYAITDEDGKYHFPYIETGQRLLKIDPATLPEESIITTDSPKRIIATKGVLTKVSFGVKLPEETQPQDQTIKEAPLLKVSISQDPVLLKPHLNVSAEQIEDKIVFIIDTNYFLFIENADLYIYNKNYNKIKSIKLPKPLPSEYTLPIRDLPPKQEVFYYQLSVYDKDDNEDRTGMGSFKIK